MLHMDLTPIEQAAETIFAKQLQLYFTTATMAWLAMILLTKRDVPSSSSSDEKIATRKQYSKRSAIAIVVITLLMPHILEPHRHRHPIIRRSLIARQSTSAANNQHYSLDAESVNNANDNNKANNNAPIMIQQELVFTVDKMTCGGCGSHVRNLVEANLEKQQQQQTQHSNMSVVDKVAVDWRAGVLSIYGGNLNEFVDRNGIIDLLTREGYPTSFLYVS